MLGQVYVRRRVFVCSSNHVQKRHFEEKFAILWKNEIFIGSGDILLRQSQGWTDRLNGLNVDIKIELLKKEDYMFNTELGTVMKSKSIKKIKPKSSSKGASGQSTAIKAKGGEGCLPIR